MSRDRTRTRDRSGDGTTDAASEFDVDLGEATGESTGTDQRAEESAGLRGRVGRRAQRIFSPRIFIAALLVSFAAAFGTNAFVPLPGAGLVGIFAVAFAFGLVLAERRYAELAAAGGLATALSVLLDFVVVAFLGGFGPSLAVLGGAVGAGVAALGTYFGRDLRHGLTRDVP